MRYDDVWIAGTGSFSGRPLLASDAVDKGLLKRHLAEGIGAYSVSESDLAAPEMALSSAIDAISSAKRSGTAVGPQSMLIHSYTNFQGLELWPVECWLAGKLLGEHLDSLPISVTAGSNGSLAILQLAADTLVARPTIPSIVATTADRFPEPWDRWNLSPGMLFGDGAASAVVTRGSGLYSLNSLVCRTDTSLEGLSRGSEEFASAPKSRSNSRSRSQDFLASGQMALGTIRSKSAAGIRSVVSQALEEADTTLADIAWYIPPFVGRTLHNQGFQDPIGSTSLPTLLELGLRTGHMGPVDGLFALDHLVTHGLCQPGDQILVVGTGMGFSFSAAVLTASRPSQGEEN